MNVLMFGWEFPPHNSGGLGVACQGLANALVSHSNVDLTFVLPTRVPLGTTPCQMLFADNRDPSIRAKVEVADVCLEPYVTSQSYYALQEKRADGVPYAGDLFSEVLRYGKLSGAIARRSGCEIIHAHDWLSFEAGVGAKRETGQPLVVHVHATEFDRSGDNPNPNVCDIEYRGMDQADEVVTVSQYTKDKVVSKYGINPDKVSVVHNGIDKHEYDRMQEIDIPHSIKQAKMLGFNIVLFVGRITFQKGPDYFVQMAKKVLRHNPKTFFVVSGSGDMENQMLREVAAAGMSHRFIFTGFIRGADLSSIYRSADIYIMPSVSEPFGITPLESMIQGTPVLISRQSGVSETINHALKANFWDVDDMANKVVSVLSHTSLRSSLSGNGQREVERIDWLTAGKKCVDIYNRLLARPETMPRISI